MEGFCENDELSLTSNALAKQDAMWNLSRSL
jgi:hypothetical protein